MVNDERKAPSVATKPPKNAVFLIPIRSTSNPDIGDIIKVVPINNDPRREAIVSDLSNPSFSYLVLRDT